MIGYLIVINILLILKTKNNISDYNKKEDNIQTAEEMVKFNKEFESYNKSIELLPQIIQNPDYVGYNSKNNGIEYIKRVNELTLVAVRLKSKGDIFFRSIYPISETKLQNGINKNRIKKI